MIGEKNNDVSREQRVAELKKELEALKRELKNTRGAWKWNCVADEIRNVAAQLAKYMD